MQSNNCSDDLSRSQRELASLVGPGDPADGQGANVPSVMGSNVWDELADSARVNIEDLELSDEMQQALMGKEEMVRQLLIAVQNAVRSSLKSSVEPGG